MRKIAVFLTKGGVGKTTTAVNVAAGLARRGSSVLLIDTDTQGHVAPMLGVRPAAGLAQVITEELAPEETVTEARERLWLLTGGEELAGAKRLIAQKDFGGEHTLQEALVRVEGMYDYVVLDTSPGWDVLNVNVLFYAQEVLAPVSVEVLTLQSLREFAKRLTEIQPYHAGLHSSISCRLFSMAGFGNPKRYSNSCESIMASSCVPRSGTVSDFLRPLATDRLSLSTLPVRPELWTISS